MQISIGQRFGSRVVIGFETASRNYSKAITRCDCGSTLKQHPSELLKGLGWECRKCVHTRVLATKPRLRHGFARAGGQAPEYKAWLHAIQRCHNPRGKSFPDYGGRGIEVHESWRGARGFDRFLAHIGPRPSPGHSLDRIDTNGSYMPGNVRWATKIEQMNNTRRSKLLTIGGEARTQAEWARQANIDPRRVHARIKSGWPPEKAVLTPARACVRRS